MPMRLRVFAALVVLHLAAGAVAWSADVDRLAAIVAGTIYLPLWPLGELGWPVYRNGGWMFRPLSWVGWLVVVAFWLAVDWALASGLARLIERRRGAP